MQGEFSHNAYITGLFILHSVLPPTEDGNGKCTGINSEVGLWFNDLLRKRFQEKLIRENVEQEKAEHGCGLRKSLDP